MEKSKAHVAILIASYNGRAYLAECLPSIFQSSYSDIVQKVFIVDNHSSDGTREYVRDNWPHVRLIENDYNAGYAGGNNIGLEVILREMPSAEYLLLLNEDTVVEPNFLSALVARLSQDKFLGCVQPRIMLFHDRERVNSLGNVIHFLGFGYSGYSNCTWTSITDFQRSINYASGACVLLRMSAIKKVGLFDSFMFMYLEDLDLGWRLKLAGIGSELVPESVIYHKYEFSRGMKHYYYFERNRLWIILKNYKIATLAVIFPAWFIMELGQLLRASMRGELGIKLSTYGFFLVPKNFFSLMRARRSTQALRTVPDKQIIKHFSGKIDFQPLQEPLVRYIANPLFSCYHSVIKYLIIW